MDNSQQDLYGLIITSITLIAVEFIKNYFRQKREKEDARNRESQTNGDESDIREEPKRSKRTGV